MKLIGFCPYPCRVCTFYRWCWGYLAVKVIVILVYVILR